MVVERNLKQTYIISGANSGLKQFASKTLLHSHNVEYPIVRRFSLNPKHYIRFIVSNARAYVCRIRNNCTPRSVHTKPLSVNFFDVCDVQKGCGLDPSFVTWR